jgi:lysocardiolipin and lysophospholipid acyltransferase
VNFYWRRFRVADMPLDNAEKFELWLRDRWYEKDAFMEQYLSTGRFPASESKEGSDDGVFIETEVRTKYWWEIAQVFVIVGTCRLLWNAITNAISRLVYRA